MKKFYHCYNKIDKRILAVCGVLLLVVSLMAPHLVLLGAVAHYAAIYTTSVNINEIRKKAGTVVYSKNKYGPFFRKRVKGTNPRTTKQINVRAVISYLSKNWKALTPTNRLNWNTYGQGRNLKNRLGLGINLTGENWYIKLNRILATVGSTYIANPPSPSAIPPPLVLAPAATVVSGTSIGLSCTTAPPSGASFSVFASKGLSQGKNYNSDYRFITKWVTADTNTFDITAAYVAVFGSVPVTGNKIFFLLKSTDTTNGLENQSQAIQVIV